MLLVSLLVTVSTAALVCLSRPIPRTLSLFWCALGPLQLFLMFVLTRVCWWQIWGGSGSVGTYAVQLAHESGYRVIAVAGARNADAVKALGADVVVDHSAPDVIDKIIAANGGHTLTYALDVIGSATATRCLAALHKDKPAFLHTIAGEPSEKPANVKVTGGMLAAAVGQTEIETSIQKIAVHLEALIAKGQLKPNEVEVLDGGLAAVPKGLQLLADGKVSGKKLVVRVAH